MLVLGMHR